MLHAPPALFLADHPALDFLNTRYGLEGREVIPDGAALLAWLVEGGWIDAPTAHRLERRWGPASLDELAAAARKLREWATTWIARWSETPKANFSGELRKLNDLLAHKRAHAELKQGRNGFELIEHEELDAPPQLLARLAEPLAQLVAAEPPELVKQCAGHDCTLWFLDKTKSHRRRFCSAAACGNRAKVAAYRERQRE